MTRHLLAQQRDRLAQALRRVLVELAFEVVEVLTHGAHVDHRLMRLGQLVAHGR